MALKISTTTAPLGANDLLLSPHIRLQNLMNGLLITRSIYAVTQANIPDLLAESPKTPAQLSAAAGLHEQSLYRTLRLLASYGVFYEQEDGCFINTDMSDILRTDVPGSLHDFALMWLTDWVLTALQQFPETLRTGKTSFDLAFGMNQFEWFRQNPDEFEKFSKAMNSFFSALNGPLVRGYDFSAVRTIADIGGAYGNFVTAALQMHPHINAVLFDLPPVIARASEHLSEDVRSRVELVAGNFFQKVPIGADVYVLKTILHDWGNGDCIRILQSCRRAMRADSRVLVMEQIIEPGNYPGLVKVMDVAMLVANTGGQERMLAEFEHLFAQSSLRLNRVIATACPFSIIEALPA